MGNLSRPCSKGRHVENRAVSFQEKRYVDRRRAPTGFVVVMSTPCAFCKARIISEQWIDRHGKHQRTVLG